MKMKTLLGCVLLLATNVVLAAHWDYLGEGTNGPLGKEFSYYIDTSTIESNGPLYGFWLKYDLHNSPYYVVAKYSISCRKENMVLVAYATYDSHGRVMAYNTIMSDKQFTPYNSIIRSVMGNLCGDQNGDQSKPSMPNFPRP